MGAVRSGAGSMGSVGTAVVSLSPVAASGPKFPLPTGICKRKSWLCHKYEINRLRLTTISILCNEVLKNPITYRVTNTDVYQVLMSELENMQQQNLIVWFSSRPTADTNRQPV